jgi:DMSO/TMAO reductase YedYZ molybdopterin-dependent catalytic subunit
MSFRAFRQWASIVLLAMSYGPLSEAASSCLGGPSTGFMLSGAVNKPKTFKAETLNQYQKSKVTVTYFSGKDGLVTKTYIGVPLIDLINEAEVITDSTRKNDILRKYLTITATDCYQVIVSLPEILPNFGGQQALVAFEQEDGQPLDASEGMARLIIPGDKAGGRLVSNVTRIWVRSSP